jgi:LysM repeat protein
MVKGEVVTLMRWLNTVHLILLLAFVGAVQAQDTATCTALVAGAAAALADNCAELVPGDTCYAPPGAFPDAPDGREWSAAVQQIETTDGAPLVVLLLGDATLITDDAATNDADETPPPTALNYPYNPDAAVPPCAETPHLVAFYSEDKQPVSLRINGANASFSGLVTLQWRNANSLTAAVHAGTLTLADNVAASGETHSLVMNSESRVVYGSAPRPAEAEETTASQTAFRLLGALGYNVEPTPPDAVNTCGSDVRHTIASGETLFRIALDYGTTADALVAANDIADPARIYAGQELIVPCPGSVTYADAAPTPPVAQGTMPAPDTGMCDFSSGFADAASMADIAAQYNVTLDALLAANGIQPGQMPAPGQTLVIPCP